MEINIEIKENNKINKYEVDLKKFQIMMFLSNALDDGWSVKKKNENSFVFSKNHEGKKEIFSENYITEFVRDNFDIKKYLC
jgi:hypothetical protein